jgi:hypothetical protein
LKSTFVTPGQSGSLALVECKAARSVTPSMATPMQRLRDAVTKKRRQETVVKMFLVHQAPKVKSRIEAVAPGVRALAWRDFLKEL